MTDHLDINRRNWDERAAIHARDVTGDYLLDRFRAARTRCLRSKRPNSASGRRDPDCLVVFAAGKKGRVKVRALRAGQAATLEPRAKAA
jgi:hypothetical protein